MDERDIEDVRKIYDMHGEYFVERENKNPDRKNISKIIISMLGDVKGKKILDAGCGASRDASLLAKAGARVTGVDISPKMLELAKKTCAGPDVELYMKDMQKTSFPDKEFDIIISIFSVAYKKNLADLLSEFKRVLKENGKLLISTVHPIRKMMKYTKNYFETGKHWEKWENGMKTFNYYRTVEEYINTLISQGFVLEEIREVKSLTKDPKESFYPHYLILKAVKATKSGRP